MRRGTAWAFLLVRIERLYPMLIAALAVATLLVLTNGLGAIDPARLPILLLAGLTMVPLAGVHCFPLLAPQWSLAIELYGNMIHFGLRRWMTMRAILIALPVLLGAMVAGAAIHGGLGSGWAMRNVGGGIATFLFCYTLGVLLQRLLRGGLLPRIALPAWAIVLLLVGTLVIPQTLRTPSNAVRDLLCALIVYPIVIVAALDVRLNRVEAWLARWLGRLSYPLYVVHYPVVVTACALLTGATASRKLHYLATVPILAIATGLAWVLLIAFDEPVRARLKSVRHLRAARQPSAGPA